MEGLNPMGEFYRRGHLCPCGSGLVSDQCRDERGADVKACERCKPALLYRILEDRHLDIFEDWISKLLDDPGPLGYQWQWEDLLKEKGCEQVASLEEAARGEGHFTVRDPYGEEGYVLVPREYGERVLKEGRMV